MSFDMSIRHLVYIAASVQVVYMVSIQGLAVVLPIDTRSFHLAAGLLGGAVVGVSLTGAVPGIAWREKQFGSVEAASYGAVAAVLGAAGFFVFVAGYGLISTFARNGVFAPQIILTAVGAIGFAYVVFNLLEGFVIGTLSFWVASLFR